MIRIIRYALAGILGALIAWAVMEPTSLMPDPRPGEAVTISYAANFIIGLVSGLLIGVSLGIADAFSGLAPRDAVRRIFLGALIGAGSGILGISFANAIFSPIESYARSNPTLFSFLMLLFARGVGWAILGSFIGLTQGIATNSTRRMVNGLIGGFIGGAIGGSSFR